MFIRFFDSNVLDPGLDFACHVKHETADQNLPGNYLDSGEWVSLSYSNIVLAMS